jgi:hypothetical protein
LVPTTFSATHSFLQTDKKKQLSSSAATLSSLDPSAAQSGVLLVSLDDVLVGLFLELMNVLEKVRADQKAAASASADGAGA